MPAGTPGLSAGPGTEITGGPAPLVAPGPQRFTFDSPTAGASFQCSLDGAAFAACASPYTTPALGAGAHLFVVRAIGPDGTVDPGGASASFTVVAGPAAGGADVVGDGLAGAPALTAVSVTRRIRIGASLHGRSAPGFRFRLSEPATVSVLLARGIGCRGTRCRRWVEAGRLPPRREPAGASVIPFSGTVARVRLPAGLFRATITAYDAAGTPSRPGRAIFSLTASAPRHRKAATRRRRPERRAARR